MAYLMVIFSLGETLIKNEPRYENDLNHNEFGLEDLINFFIKIKMKILIGVTLGLFFGIIKFFITSPFYNTLISINEDFYYNSINLDYIAVENHLKNVLERPTIIQEISNELNKFDKGNKIEAIPSSTQINFKLHFNYKLDEKLINKLINICNKEIDKENNELIERLYKNNTLKDTDIKNNTNNKFFLNALIKKNFNALNTLKLNLSYENFKIIKEFKLDDDKLYVSKVADLSNHFKNYTDTLQYLFSRKIIDKIKYDKDIDFITNLNDKMIAQNDFYLLIKKNFDTQSLPNISLNKNVSPILNIPEKQSLLTIAFGYAILGFILSVLFSYIYNLIKVIYKKNKSDAL